MLVTAVAGYVGEGSDIPVSKPSFTSTTLTEKKLGVIVIYTKDLLRQATLPVEQLVARDATEACAQTLDGVFVSDSAATVSTPAGIRNGVTELTAGSPDALLGQITTADEVRLFVGAALRSFTSVNNGGGVYFTMSEGLRIGLSLMRNALGQVEFPGMQTAASTTGVYTLEGVPVVTSNNVADNLVIAIKPEDIWTLNYDTVEVSMSDQAQVTTAPGSPAETHNLWQEEKLGIRLVLPNNWAHRRTAGVIA